MWPFADKALGKRAASGKSATQRALRSEHRGRREGVPHPGCFGKRGWICLIPKELRFLGATKRLQALEGSRVRGGAAGEVWGRWSGDRDQKYHRCRGLS